MAKSVTIPDELYRRFGELGHRDESWADVFARAEKHLDWEAAKEDKRNRTTTYEENGSVPESTTQNGYTKETGHPELQRLEDGTRLRHEFKRGEYAGETVYGRITGGHVEYDGDEYSPSKAVEVAVEDVKGKRVPGNGWTWWEFYDDDTDEWRKLDTIRE